MAEELTNGLLKCTIIITGLEGSEKANVVFDFNPPIKDGTGWDDSGAGALAMRMLTAAKPRSNDDYDDF